MPRYVFDLSGPEFPPDRVDVELPGPEQAREEAVRAAGELLKDIGGAFWADPTWRMKVTDEEGRTVCILTLTGERGEPWP